MKKKVKSCDFSFFPLPVINEKSEMFISKLSLLKLKVETIKICLDNLELAIRLDDNKLIKSNKDFIMDKLDEILFLKIKED